jgi:hypothetical protein
MFHFANAHPIKHAALTAMAQLEYTALKADHWIGDHPGGDSSEEYCLDCCQKAIALLESGLHTDGETPLDQPLKEEVVENTPFVDGGWNSEYDRIVMCHSCHAFLTGSPTACAVDEELTHYEMVQEEKGSAGGVISTSAEAYTLLEMIDAATHDSATERLSHLAEWFTVNPITTDAG